ncbi:MAG: phosphohydrolase [Ramlibacter sp.]|nr:phosphohydrolase [Cryobacterium sp.]
MTTLLDDAIHFARVAYADRRDSFGRPAIEHPLRVMDALASEDNRIVAVLHDTLVNSVATVGDLRAFLPSRLLMAVTALGHTDEDADGISLQSTLADPIALTVKLACIADLSDPARLADLDPFTRRSREAQAADAARALGTTLPAVRALMVPVGVPH